MFSCRYANTKGVCLVCGVFPIRGVVGFDFSNLIIGLFVLELLVNCNRILVYSDTRRCA